MMVMHDDDEYNDDDGDDNENGNDDDDDNDDGDDNDNDKSTVLVVKRPQYIVNFCGTKPVAMLCYHGRTSVSL